MYPAVVRPSEPPEPLGNAGGMSGSSLWRYRSGSGRLVARAWPIDGPSFTALEQIHGWLAEVGPLGFIPVPLRGLDGRTLYERSGRFWEITPWMTGAAPPTPPDSTIQVQAAFATLGAVHQRLAGTTVIGQSPGLLSRLREVERSLGGGFSEAERLLARSEADPLHGLARDWLEATRNEAPRLHALLIRTAGVAVSLQPCLRDVRPDHLLFTDHTLTGLIDFGAMGIDSVAGDLARLLLEWLGQDAHLRSVAIDAYASVRPISAVETSLIEVFERSAAVLGGGHWVRWHFVEGRRFEDPQAVGRGLARALERLRTIPSEGGGLPVG